MKTTNAAIHGKQRDRILDMACDHFAQHGFKETSMNDIAQACKMKKPSLYHYFTSKEEILQILLQEHMSEIHQHAQQNIPGESFKEFLMNIGKNFMESLKVKRSRGIMLILTRYANYDSSIQKIAQPVFTKNLQILHKMMKAAGNHKYTTPFCTMAVDILIMQLINRMVIKSKKEVAQPISDEKYLQMLVTLLVQGLNSIKR